MSLPNEILPTKEEIIILIKKFDKYNDYQDNQIENVISIINQYGLIGYIAFNAWNTLDVFGVSCYTADEYISYIHKFCKNYVKASPVPCRRGHFPSCFNSFEDRLFLNECVRRSFGIHFFDSKCPSPHNVLYNIRAVHKISKFIFEEFNKASIKFPYIVWNFDDDFEFNFWFEEQRRKNRIK